jgi:hypothetical protein
MTHIVRGSLKGSGEKFDGQWMIDSIIFKLTGEFNKSVPPFVVSSARLNYDDVSNLKGEYDIVFEASQSFVGVGDINLMFKNDDDLEFKITGKLDDPIDERVSVNGFGKWP